MPSRSPFPVLNSTQPYWRTELDPLDNHRTTEKLPTEADIVVIGAGYAGASTVYHLLEKTKHNTIKPSITILEAREACSGATGRNGGHVKPDLYNRPDSIAAEYGLEAAAEAAAFEADHINAIRDLVEKEKIDCDFVITRAVDVQLKESIRDKLKAGYDRLVKGGVAATKDVFFASEDTAEAASGVRGAKGCFSYTAGHIWPYKLVLHLLRNAVSQGVNLQTHTPVQQVSSTQDINSRWTITTARGVIKAKFIVYASNAYTSAILPEYKNTIVPVRGICSRIVTPKAPAPYLPNTYILRWSAWQYDYLIPRTDGSIIVGGARAHFFQDLENWYDIADDSKLIESAKHYFDGYMQRHFRGWEESEAYTDKVWTGIMGYTSDYLPHVGAVPAKSNQFIIAGFSGHGMPQIFLSGKAIASMIIEGKEFSETGVPRIYETSQSRLSSQRNMILEGWQDANGTTSPKL